MGMTIITAHSGCERTPRDSLASVQRALACAADAIEVDVRADTRGNLRIAHDPLTEQDQASKPTLRQVLDMIAATGLRLNCDLKEQRVLYDVLAMARDAGFGPERLFLTGCLSPEQLARDPAICRQATVMVNIEEILKMMAAGPLLSAGRLSDFTRLMDRPWSVLEHRPLTAAETGTVMDMVGILGARALNMPVALLDQAFIEQAAAARVPLSVWTVNQAADIDRCLAAGTFNITTLNVALAVQRRQGR